MAGHEDVAVVGAGIVGLSTAYALAQRGAAVRLYELGAPGNGQSGGEGRIFRHAHDDPHLIAFAKESRAGWRAWEARFGTELVSADGSVAIGDAVPGRLAALERTGGVAARPIDAAELAERMPLLAPYEGPAMLDEDGGSLRTRAAIAALTGALGDRLIRDEVLSVRPTPAGTVEIRTGGGTSEHASVVVCAGRATAQLARGAGLELPVRLSAHVRATFATRGAPARRLACLQDSSGAWGESGVYATAMPGNRRVSLGIGQNAGAAPDGTLADPAALGGLALRAGAYALRALPGLDPVPLGYRHCWVTSLPWGDDAFAAWRAGAALFLAGNNLFKLAPALGRVLAAAALGEPRDDVLRPATWRDGRAVAAYPHTRRATRRPG